MKRIVDLQKVVGVAESQSIEWKPSLSQMSDIIETIAAFSNTEGGKLFIGVSDAGKLLGVNIGKATIENFTNRIHQKLDPVVHPRVTVKEVNGKQIIIVHVRESLKRTILAFGRPYKRVGKSTVQMSQEEYEQRILERHKDKLQFDTQICPRATLKDIDAKKVRWFLLTAKEERNFDVPARISVKEALERLELMVDGKIMNAAILLFGKKPQKYFGQAKIRCGRIKGADGHDFMDMKILEGTIPELRESAIRFITGHIKHAIYFDANQRFDRWEYPLRALEELITNALAHRDYFSNSDIQIAIYDGRIEIWNPGELPSPLTPADLKRKHKSIPRNRCLADKLFLIKYIERWGKGTNRVLEEMKTNGLPEPKFQNLSGGFEVELFCPDKTFVQEIEKEKYHKLDLNDRQKKAIKYITDKESITRKEYVAMVKVSLRQANIDLADLVDKKIISQVGKGRSVKYIMHD